MKVDKDKMVTALNTIYDKSLEGIPKVSPPINVLADNYLLKNISVEKAAKIFIKNQKIKCASSGFATSFGGFITMPVTLPANVTSVMYFQMRMIACIAYMGGYDVNSDQVQTMIYVCLAGLSLEQLLKNAGIKIAEKCTLNLIEKIPGKVLTKINQAVGFRLITKFGEKGVINLGKGVPIVGAVVGGSFDYFSTRVIANRAYKMFIENDLNVLNEVDD